MNLLSGAVVSTHRALLAASIGCLLVSCNATRFINPAPEDLTNLVLVLKELPDGQVIHTWQRADEFDLSHYKYTSVSGNTSGHIMFAAARQRDCDQELQDCYRDCMRRPLPPGYGHVKSPRSSGGKSEYCRETCWQPYQDCVEVQGLQPQEFTSMDSAVVGLKLNRETLWVGSVVLIAGVAFVTVSAGAGLFVLAPLALVVMP